MKEMEIKQTAQELELCRAQLDSMEKQDELLRVTLDEYRRAKEALEDIKGRKDGDEVLVPIGANCFLHAKLGDPNRVMSSLGSDVAVGESSKDAIVRLDRHIQDIEKAVGEMQKNISSLSSKTQELTRTLQKAYEEFESKSK
jgi:prefoldin alpha subunit